jgi:catechol 2,3-dioxygenase-like lactoylglutathione lyase family enzyme/SAM-dependent methyltransferase
MTSSTGPSPVKFHLSLNVTNLTRSIAFYRVLFGREPAKLHDDYAKFEIEDPPVIFSLVPRAPAPGGPLRYIGLRISDPGVVELYRERLAAAGVETRTDRLRVRDPDGVVWEVGQGSSGDDPVVSADVEPAPLAEPAADAAWEHFVTHDAPKRIPHDDASLDEVRLTGTFNAKLDESQRMFVLGEARRVLRPGGRVLVHGLMADGLFPGSQPTLPGLAAMVSRVPAQTEPAAALQAAGFVGIRIVKYNEKPWFEHDGVGLREVKILGRQPYVNDPKERAVVYRGPFREAIDDDGRNYPRNQLVAIPSAVWQLLRESPAAEQFEFR